MTIIKRQELLRFQWPASLVCTLTDLVSNTPDILLWTPMCEQWCTDVPTHKTVPSCHIYINEYCFTTRISWLYACMKHVLNYCRFTSCTSRQIYCWLCTMNTWRSHFNYDIVKQIIPKYSLIRESNFQKISFMVSTFSDKHYLSILLIVWLIFQWWIPLTEAKRMV